MQLIKTTLILISFTLLIAILIPQKILHAAEDSTKAKTTIHSLLSKITEMRDDDEKTQSFDELLNQAEEYFNAALYLRAIPIYEKIILLSPNKVRYRLAQSYFLAENYAAVVATLSSVTDLQPKENYLLGLAYRKLGQYEKAVAALERYLKVTDPLHASFHQEAQFELGLAYFLWKKPEEAKKQFIPLAKEADSRNEMMPLPTYVTRALLYITRIEIAEGSFYAKRWYLQGLNEFEEGQSLLMEHEKNPTLTTQEEANLAFERAINFLRNAFELLQPNRKIEAGLALKYQAQAAFLQKKQEKIVQAIETLDLLFQHPEILGTLSNPDEIFYLKGLMAAHLSKGYSTNKYTEIAQEALQQGINNFPKGKFSEAAQYLLATLDYHQGRFNKAEEQFVSLSAEFPQSPLAGDALFWASCCAENDHNSEKCKHYRSLVYQHYPNSPFAAEAYFRAYSYQDYLQGDRAAIKHLHAMPERYPQAPLVMNAWYLIGLDYKRDRKTATGKWICKRNLNAAVDAFEAVEAAFDFLNQEKLLKEDNLDYALTVCYRARLECGLAYLTIADEAQGAKRQIYLEYAEEVFQKLHNDFKSLLVCSAPCSNIQEENAYWLAQTCLKANKESAAEELLIEMLDKYRSAKITRGYFLSRGWYDLGLIASYRNEYKVALQCYREAVEAAKGKVLSTDQKLDLWIQQSLCHKALQEMDDAILLLSKVVNDDAVSSLRIKAMYLRAEIYESQGRRELARKQLESTSKKGGEWALKAKAKLDQDYGHH